MCCLWFCLLNSDKTQLCVSISLQMLSTSLCAGHCCGWWERYSRREFTFYWRNKLPIWITLGKERNGCHETIEGNCLEFQQDLFRLLSMISKVIMELHWPVIKYRHQRSSGSATCVIEGDNYKWEQLRARAGSHGKDPGDRKDLVGELQYPQRKSVLMNEARLE